MPNPFAQELLAEMATWEPGFIERDGWLLFLYVKVRLTSQHLADVLSVYRKALLLLSLPTLAPSPTGLRDPSSSLAGLDVRLLAMDTLVSSVKLQPYNWTAWLKIANCIEGPEEVSRAPAMLGELSLTLTFCHSSKLLSSSYLRCPPSSFSSSTPPSRFMPPETTSTTSSPTSRPFSQALRPSQVCVDSYTTTFEVRRVSRVSSSSPS